MVLKSNLEFLRDKVNSIHPTRQMCRHLKEIGEEKEETWASALKHAKHEAKESPLQEIREHMRKRNNY